MLAPTFLEQTLQKQGSVFNTKTSIFIFTFQNTADVMVKIPSPDKSDLKIQCILIISILESDQVIGIKRCKSCPWSGCNGHGMSNLRCPAAISSNPVDDRNYFATKTTHQLTDGTSVVFHMSIACVCEW